jgi:hypothetical protein
MYIQFLAAQNFHPEYDREITGDGQQSRQVVIGFEKKLAAHHAGNGHQQGHNKG